MRVVEVMRDATAAMAHGRGEVRHSTSKLFPGHESLTLRERVTLAQIVRGASSKMTARTMMTRVWTGGKTPAIKKAATSLQKFVCMTDGHSAAFSAAIVVAWQVTVRIIERLALPCVPIPCPRDIFGGVNIPQPAD
jgi:hypothetical protein